MKTNLKLLFYFFALPLFSRAQIHPQIKAGAGPCLILQGFHYLNDELNNQRNNFYFRDLNETGGTHFTVQQLIPLQQNYFIAWGCDMDYTHFSFRTYGVPDKSFANSKLYFDQKQVWADIPLGFGVRMKTSKKPLLLQGGASIGMIYNFDSKIRYDIFNPDDAHYVAYRAGLDRKATLSSGIWFKIQYQLFKYNCLSYKGMWIEGMIRQNLLYNTVQTFEVAFTTPQQTYAYTYAYQNRTLVAGLSCLFEF
ncbi:MAG: hypothetical protein JNL13_09305 [Chitinophagaceae bacterium]|nr:hypothetical protein [Chitinophagaceae bacterium]